MPRRLPTSLTAAAAIGALALIALPGPAAAAPHAPAGSELGVHDPRLSRTLRLAEPITPAPARPRRMTRQAEGPTGAGGAVVGDGKTWLVYDETTQQYSTAEFVLRGIGDRIEVWVQADIDFPAGDCRNDGVRNVITDVQVNELVTEFDQTILPTMSTTFSVAPDRDGSGAPAADDLGGGDPGFVAGAGDTTITLVSNIRDANYYDQTSPDGSTFIAGFFDGALAEYFNRNVMNIDAYDWRHRTGANPPDDGDPEPCTPEQPARPRFYEGKFAHEYQHLLEYYASPGQAVWLNEGLGDYAQAAVGYEDPRRRYPQTGYSADIACFEGYGQPSIAAACGAENSLTRWGDQGGPSILADYGAAYSFLVYLRDRFGRGVITALHTSGDTVGLAAVQTYLDRRAPGVTVSELIGDWAAELALDRRLDRGARGVTGALARRFTATHLSSSVNWETPQAYDSPGAPPNGSDYVLARGVRPLTGSQINRLSFAGASSYAPDPLEWTVDAGALYSGAEAELDRAAVFAVTVPTQDPTLRFGSRYDIESGWDFGVVQISTDGGRSYTSLANADTTSDHQAEADPRIISELPGFTGLAEAETTQTFDLSAYAGRPVLLSFRYLTDAQYEGNGGGGPSGWWVRDVRVGATIVTDGTRLSGARSATEVRPLPVSGWKVQLVGWTTDGTRVRYVDLRPRAGAVSVTALTLRRQLGGMDRVGVIVTALDPAESATKNARYQLKVNGIRQPGG